MLNLFYEEPDNDRWIRFDRYPRRVIRRLVRGATKPGGVMRWFLNLQAGLDLLGVRYRINDYAHLRRSSGAWALVVGKPQVIEKIPAVHPIIFGPAVASHPIESNFWGKADIRLILLSCVWFKEMYDRDLPVPIPTTVWPAGIDTQRWCPRDGGSRRKGILVYDKIRWNREHFEPSLLHPILKDLRGTGETIHLLRYGSYEEDDYQALLPSVRAMIFLCEHETQGFAYLQALSSGVPICAWDRRGFWQDPFMYPDRVKFEPVTSVPYFDSRCGMRFRDLAQFREIFPPFWHAVQTSAFQPREYVLENLTLEKCAQRYLKIVGQIAVN